MNARNTLLSLAFPVCLCTLAGCAASPAAARSSETPAAHPMLGFAVAGNAPRPPIAAEGTASERYREPGRIYDAMHGYSSGSPR
jgi:hypothetical protein